MNQKRLWIAAAIIALAIIIGFVLSVPHTTRDIATQPVTSATNVAVPAVALHDAFKKGTHTISGSIETPNACTTVTAEASLLGNASSTPGIMVALSIVPDKGVCLQLPTRVKFSTTVAAPAQLPISVTVNGLLATTTAS